MSAARKDDVKKLSGAELRAMRDARLAGQATPNGAGTAVAVAVDNVELLGTSPADLLDRVEPPPSTPEEARRRAEKIRAGLVSYVQTRAAIAEAWARRDWKTLGYDSWEAYLGEEFGEELRRLTGDERREAVREFREQGMSTRAIAGAVKAGQSTVRDDLKAAEVSGSTHLTTTVAGTDGKTYSAKKPVSDAALHAAEKIVNDRIGSGKLIRLVGGNLIDAESFDPAVHVRADDSATAPAELPRPPKWDPEERRKHEEEVRRTQDIESARQYSKTIVTQVRSLVVTIVTGCRYGEKGLVTAEMIADLRKAIDLLEGEIDDAQ